MVLVKNGADVNILDINFESPLSLFAFHTSRKESQDIAKILIEYGASVDLRYRFGEKGNYGDTPLHNLVRRGVIEKVQEILDAKPEAIMIKNGMGILAREIPHKRSNDDMWRLLVSEWWS